MNLLYGIILFYAVYYVQASKKASTALTRQDTSLVLVEDTIANSREAQDFKKALQRRDRKTAQEIFEKGKKELKDYCAKHLISLGCSNLIKLFKSGKDNLDWSKQWVMQVLLMYADKSLIDTVLGALKYASKFFWTFARSADLACAPQKLIYLINKIGNKKYQEEAVRGAVSALVRENRLECFDPLFTALKGGLFLSTELEDIAINHAFNTASRNPNDRSFMAKRFFDHPAVLAEDYTDALFLSYMHGDQSKELFYWLLERADSQDLEATMKDEFFSQRDSNFQAAVNQAMKAVGDENRHEAGRKRRIATGEHVPRTPLKPISSIMSLSLDKIDPYDNDPSTKLYLEFGCIYMIRKQVMKYEAQSVRNKIGSVYYTSCMDAVWPGSSYRSIPKVDKCHLASFEPFKKGATLAYHNGESLKASSDGYIPHQPNSGCFVRYYHPDKPPMKLDVLRGLPWPQDNDSLAFRNFGYETYSILSLETQSNPLNATIKLDSTTRKNSSFVELKQWIQGMFKLNVYNAAQLKLLGSALKRDFPGVDLNKIHKSGSMTSVLSFHNLLELIPPNTPIAIRYDPDSLKYENTFTFSKYSTIIAKSEHEGTTLFLVLTFDILPK